MGLCEVFYPSPGGVHKCRHNESFCNAFRDMAEEPLNQFHDRDRLLHIFVIFLPFVVKSDKIPVIVIDPGSGDDGTAQVTADVLNHRFRVVFVWVCVDIETIFVLPVAAGLGLFKRGADPGFHFLEHGGMESVVEVNIIKMGDFTPETVIAVTIFRNKAVDMGVPF